MEEKIIMTEDAAKRALKNSNKPFYKNFDLSSFLEAIYNDGFKIAYAPYKDTYSKNSFCFVKDQVNKQDVVSKLFLDGKLDDNIKLDSRINTVHSSALLALLFFYNVSKDNPIKINNVTYTKSYFEVGNKVFDNPSKVDVALVSKDNKTVLYLESKFTEYLSGKKSGAIKLNYKDFLYKVFETYSDNSLTSGQIRDNKTGKIEDVLYIHGNPYGEGVKQMIAHFIGICKGGTDNNPLNGIIKNAVHIYLGEILFDFNSDEISHAKTRLDSYTKQYNKLQKRLNKLLPQKKVKTVQECGEKETSPEVILKNAPKNFEVLQNLLTYQMLINSEKNKAFKNNMNDNIKKFYQY